MNKRTLPIVQSPCQFKGSLYRCRVCGEESADPSAICYPVKVNK
jgi:hypothetical protein